MILLLQRERKFAPKDERGTGAPPVRKEKTPKRKEGGGAEKI